MVQRLALKIWGIGIAAAMLVAALPGTANAQEQRPGTPPLLADKGKLGNGHEAAPDKPITQLLFPIMNPERGKRLYVSKGCVACHAINGVGGHDAPNLDAHSMMPYMNPFEFAAKMWRGAAAMIAAQEGAFDEQIQFTGQELADIIAFAHDHEAQHAFTEADLTAEARKMMDHDHGGQPAVEKHAPEIGHGPEPTAKGGHVDPPGSKPHKH